MSIHLHRAGRADRLVAALAEVYAEPLDDPFGTDVIAVPTRGVERWLAQSLARRLGRTDDDGAEPRTDGICAGVDFWSPARLVASATAAVTEVDRNLDPWEPERLTWPVLATIAEDIGEPWLAPVSHFLQRGVGGSAPAGRRLALARHLADLLARYQNDRAAMTLRWAGGEDVDPAGGPLAPEHRWQAEVFRRLRSRIGSAPPVERLPAVCARLASEPALVELPGRLSLFGATRVGPALLEILAALGRHREVHLWLPHPSPRLWSAIAAGLPDRSTAPGPRSADRSGELVRHRLLAYLGRDVRELQLQLNRLPVATDVDHDDPGRAEDHGADDHDSLLRRLQSDIATDRALTDPGDRPALRRDDRSITVHACHGPDRQVEVLRELLLGRLSDDPTLEPRDIVVMCPDVETFAPLISAAFGIEADESTVRSGLPPHPGHQLRVRLADRSLRRVNPLLAVLGAVFDLAESRIEASAVLDLCAAEPVARKFGFTEDDLQRLQRLVYRSGVRWGLDAADRRRFAMNGFGQNTWTAGLDRLLLGVAMDEDGQHFIGTTLPMDDIDAGDVETLGQLAEVVDRLRQLLIRLDRPHTAAGWVGLCRDILDGLTAAAPGESWQLAQAYGELIRIGAGAEADGTGADPVELNRAEARVLLAETFGGRPTRTNFRTGTLTVCTMLPMRSVPHRVVCLLGVDDGVFPRTVPVDGDDLLARDPWVGDRDPRSEDRQLMLDAVLSATDELVVIYSGADPRTNAARPPAVPIGELLDVLDLTAVTADRLPARAQVLHRHPLQPFDPAGFAADHPFSFDRSALAGAVALRTGRPSPPEQAAAAVATDPGRPDWHGLAPAPLPDVVEVPDLIRFLQHPAQQFLRARTGLSVRGEDEPPVEEIPVRLDGLQSWAVGDRLLQLGLQGVPGARLVDAEWRRGELPPQQLGQRTIDPVVGEVRQLTARAGPYLSGPRTEHDLEVELPDGRRLVGTASPVVGDTLVTVTYSRLAPRQRLAAWIHLLALAATTPDRPWQAVVVARGGGSRLGPVPGPTAALLLADLVDLWATGLAAPLPLPVCAAEEYARWRRIDRAVTLAAQVADRSWQKKDRDTAWELCFGAGAGFDRLTAEASVRAEERGRLGEPTRFGSLARRVWTPLLDAEVLE